MMKPDAWQVDALWFYLRAAVSVQMPHLVGEKRAILDRVIKKKPDESELEVLRNIVRIRNGLQNSSREIDLQDHGAGAGTFPRRKTIGAIHGGSAVPHWWGVFLFRLVRELKPEKVLELGTNLGVSAAYIQSALILNGNPSRLTTVEGDPTLASIARETLDAVGVADREVVLGRFQDVLPAVLQWNHPLDLVFIDGHHEYRPTLEYFDQIRPFLSGKGTVIFDDVYFWSRQVRKAWTQIIRTHSQFQPIDLAKFGILFQTK